MHPPDHAPRPATLEFWQEEVLRRAGQALQGRPVGLWESRGGKVTAIATSLGRPLPPNADAEMASALSSWKVPVQDGQRWIACRIDMGRWAIAAVRTDVPMPPPGGVERRRRERMALELAGLCLGLIEKDLATQH
jgi:hypothetical protein